MRKAIGKIILFLVFLPPFSFCQEKIVLNEIMANPFGSDKGKEWIELFNPTEKEIDISGWKIKNSKGKTFLIKEGKILPKNYFLLKFSFSFIKNHSETISLLDKKERVVDTCSFKEALSGFSYARKEAKWQWTNSPTPEKKNIFPPPLKKKLQNYEKNQDRQIKNFFFFALIFSLFLSFLSLKLLKRKKIL